MAVGAYVPWFQVVCANWYAAEQEKGYHGCAGAGQRVYAAEAARDEGKITLAHCRHAALRARHMWNKRNGKFPDYPAEPFRASWDAMAKDKRVIAKVGQTGDARKWERAAR